MTEEEATCDLYNRKALSETMEHQSRMSFLVEREEFGLFSLLKPKLYRDGNQWCVLYGDNIQDGIFGFGDNPTQAIWDWNKAWEKSIN